MGHLGFSFTGAAFLVALFVPNLVWARLPRPEGDDTARESRLLGALERIGQVLVVAAALVFDDTNPRAWSPWSWWLVAAIAVMLGYEACWIRYFAGPRTVRELVRSAVGIPVPLATLPVAAFLLLAAYGRLIPLLVATLVLGVGHVGIHLQHRAALRASGD